MKLNAGKIGFSKTTRAIPSAIWGKNLYLLLFSNTMASIGTGVAMIAIPWFIAARDGGDVLFSSLATAVNVVLFVVTPFIGPVIDGWSRKGLMVALRVVFLIGLCTVYFLHHAEDIDNQTFSLVVYYCLGATFYAFNIPLRGAFVQELFHGSVYLEVNSILEIENQVAAVLTGVCAIFLVENYGIDYLLILNASAYFLAIICISLIDVPVAAHRPEKGSVAASFAEGIGIAISRPRLSMMLMAASVPYIVVILYTVLHPVALSRLSDASSSTYALVEMLFAVGAIAGGMILGKTAKFFHSPQKVLTKALMAFAVVAVLQAFFPGYWGFVLLAAAFGFWNAVVRILRQSLLMEQVSVGEVGRLGALLQSYIMFMRALTLYVASAIISGAGVNYAILFAALFSGGAPVLFWLSSAGEKIREP